MNIYAIRTQVPYGEYVEVVCAKSKKEAEKICEKMYDGNIMEVVLIKIKNKSQGLFFGGSQE